jgi:iron complex outermembrane receptor protein
MARSTPRSSPCFQLVYARIAAYPPRDKNNDDRGDEHLVRLADNHRAQEGAAVGHGQQDLRSIRGGKVALAAVLWGLSTSFSTSAQAQEPAGPDRPAAEDEPGAQVVITGSRIARQSNDGPSPVTTVGSDELEKLAATNIGAMLSELPAFRPSNNPTTNGFGSFNVGAQIVNLRGLGVTRSLILVDGRRFAPTTREGSADLNLIPSLLIERTEMVTGGASAAYGSDAIAGVVNINLKRNLTGLTVQADYGISDEHDGDRYHFAFAGGTGLFGDRGHVVVGGEYDKQDGIGNCFVREWCRPGQVVSNGFFNNPAGVGNGLPNFVRSNDNAGFWMTSGGVVAGNNAPALRNMFGTGGIQFDADGNAVPYRPGQIVGGVTQLGGDIVPTYLNTNLTVPVERYTLFGHSDLSIADNVSAFLEASYGYVTGSVLQSSFFDTQISIARDNAFIPAAVRTVLNANPQIASFTMGRLGDDLARGYSTSTADVYRATTGLDGKLGDSATWNVYYQFGRTDRLQTVKDNRIQGDPAKNAADPTNPANFARAVDAVVDNETLITPGTGSIVCRAQLSPNPALRAAAAGCVPLNLFGVGNFSQAARDYVYGTLVEDIDISQHVIAANLQGEAFDLWAGALSLAGGVEFRRDEMEVVHDPLSNQFAYFQNFGADYNGTSKVSEAYLEAELPLLRNVTMARQLDLNVAGRHARYDFEGFGSYLRTSTSNKIDATTWKASLTWEPVEWLRLRGTRSRDVRAPNFADLYLASASNFGSVSNRFVANNPNQFPALLSGGTPDLDAERADTTTVGFIFSPTWGWSDRLQLSVDYYDIKVDGYIASAGTAQFIVDRCFAGNARACDLITFANGQSQITQIRNVSLNLDELRTRGEDIELSYTAPLGGGGQLLDFRLLASHVEETTTETFGIAVDRAGQTGTLGSAGLPKWLFRANLSYTRAPVSVTLQARYIGRGVIDSTRFDPSDAGYSPTLINSTNDNRVASATYLNLFGNFDFPAAGGASLQLFAAINNLLDKQPPSAPELQYPTNPTYFDQIGRTYRAGVRVRF